MRFGWQLTVSYSFKQTSNSAFFFVLQNVSKSKKCQFSYPLWMNTSTFIWNASTNSYSVGVCVCMCTQTLLRASTLSRHTPQANSLAFLMPCLRMQEEKSRELSSGCAHTNTCTILLPATEENVVIFILILTPVRTSLLTVNISEHQQFLTKPLLNFYNAK